MSDEESILLRVSLPGNGRPFLMNAMKGIKYWAYNTHRDKWKRATDDAIAYEGIADLRLDRVRFSFVPCYTHSPPDPGAVAPTTKFIVDALVEANILPDDNGFHNAGEWHAPPVVTSWTGIAVKMTPKAVHVDHVSRVLCSCRADMLRKQASNVARAAARREAAKAAKVAAKSS